MQLRWYQQEAVDSVLAAIKDEAEPTIVAMPTGSGKTPTLSNVVEEYLQKYKKRVLVLSHVDNILQQNYNTLKSFLGPIVGVYSASLSRKEPKRAVVVGGIQSVYRKPELFSDVGLIIIDECHLVNNEAKGMYRKLVESINDLAWQDPQVVGLTATPFRTGQGWIHKGEDTLFKSICFTCCDRDSYNRLVNEGYLSKIYSKKTALSLDLTGVKTTAGDYNDKDLALAVDKDSITKEAVAEAVQFGKNYKKWLFFAIDIQHAENIKAELEDHGISTCCIHSKMEDDRAITLADFKNGKYRAAVNVDILTTGFDEPSIDLIVTLRPTQSPIIHVQSVGRGARVHPDKDHCLFLDFAGNTARLGPINNVMVPDKKNKGKGGGEAITKTCPECDCIHHPTVKECDACGHVFEFKVKLTRNADESTQVVQTEDITWWNVQKVSYSVHNTPGKSNSLRVQYHCGISTFSEYIAFGRKGYGGHMASHWVKFRTPEGMEAIKTFQELVEKAPFLARPKRVGVKKNGKWTNVDDYEF